MCCEQPINPLQFQPIDYLGGFHQLPVAPVPPQPHMDPVAIAPPQPPLVFFADDVIEVQEPADIPDVD
jgi:hypothetical protein